MAAMNHPKIGALVAPPRGADRSDDLVRGSRVANFLNLRKIFSGSSETTKQAWLWDLPRLRRTEVIRQINKNEYVNEEGRVAWSSSREYIEVKDPKKEKGFNNFEKTKMKKNPMVLTMENFREWAKVPSRSSTPRRTPRTSTSGSSGSAFHCRKQQYGKFMMRLKLPNGVVTSDQLRVLAQITEEAGEGGCGDITTRQNFQLRGITLQDVPDIFDRLEGCGLTTIQSGMDNVRNAVGSPIAGIDPLEIVDTIPVCNDLTEYVIDFGKMNERIANLPRKWNVRRRVARPVRAPPHQRLGYMPATKNGEFGYNLLVGGFFSATNARRPSPWTPLLPSATSFTPATRSSPPSGTLAQGAPDKSAA